MAGLAGLAGPGLAGLGWLGLALLGWLGLAGLAGRTHPGPAWPGLGWLGWPGNRLGLAWADSTIRELSGNYPGFKAGWAGWAWLGLAGLVGLGWLGWLVGPGLISFTSSECGGTETKQLKNALCYFI